MLNSIWKRLRWSGPYRSDTGLRDLLICRHHPSTVRRERENLIVVRVRQITAVSALLTLAWIGVDAFALPWPQWGEIAIGRLAVSAGLLCLAIYRFETGSVRSAYAALMTLMVLLLAFYLYASRLVGQHAAEASLATITAYYYLPFIIAAGLSVFPLTFLESVFFGSLPVLAMVAGIIIWPNFQDASAIATVWRLVLITGICGLAGISQLRFLLLFVDQSSRDGLTGVLIRKVGQEMLDQQFAYAQRNDLPFSVLFLDLDRFKKINDVFGHEAGDSVLRATATELQRQLRLQDILIRWGGEEFLIALPGADTAQAEGAMRRMASTGIGRRPDGQPMTASIGVAERKEDEVDGLQALLDLADRRLYEAKQAGRNRYTTRASTQIWLDGIEGRLDKG